MKKLIFFLLIIIPEICMGQGLHTAGVIVDDSLRLTGFARITDSLLAEGVIKVKDGIQIGDSVAGSDIWTIDSLVFSATDTAIYIDGNRITLGLSAATNYAQVITVAKSGGNFTTIQGAIDHITDATTTKRYVIKVQSGVYTENVTLKDYVDVIGAGRTNTILAATSGSALTYPANKATVSEIGINVDYGALGANSAAIVSTCADGGLKDCDITVTKSGGHFTMNGISVNAGSFRMSDCYFTYTTTGATGAPQLTQSAIKQTGVITNVILNNNEVTVSTTDTDDDLVGIETTATVTGTCLLSNNIFTIDAGAAASSATGIWAYGTCSGAIFNQNRLTVNCNASSYGIWIDSDAGGAVIDTRHNEIIVTSAGAAQSAFVALGDTWNSTFDKITAVSGYAGTGTILFVSSDIDGDFTSTGEVEANDVTVNNDLIVTGNITGNSGLDITGTEVNNLNLNFSDASDRSAIFRFNATDGLSMRAYSTDAYGGDSGVVSVDSNTLFLAQYNAGAEKSILIDTSTTSGIVIRDHVTGQGLQFYDDYSLVYGSRSAVDYEHQSTHLGYQNLNSTVYSPGAAQHGDLITWDNTSSQYVSTDVIPVGQAAGIMIVAIDTVLYSNTTIDTIVTLPVGAVIWDIQVFIETTFDGSGTDLLDVGIDGDGDKYENDLDVGVASAFYGLSNVADRMAGTTYIIFQYFDSGADAANGEAYVYVHYSIH